MCIRDSRNGGSTHLCHHFAVIVRVFPLGSENLAFCISGSEICIAVRYADDIISLVQELELINVRRYDHVILHDCYRLGKAACAVCCCVNLADLKSAVDRDQSSRCGGLGRLCLFFFFFCFYAHGRGDCLFNRIAGNSSAGHAVNLRTARRNDLLLQLRQRLAADIRGFLVACDLTFCDLAVNTCEGNGYFSSKALCGTGQGLACCGFCRCV